MKKLIALLLALLLLASLAACGAVIPAAPGGSNTKAPAPADTKAPTPDTDAPKTEPAPDTEPAPEPPPFEELTVIDNDVCSMKISSIKDDAFWGYTLKTQLENKTEDKNIRFSVESASINGVCADPYFSAEVAAGKKANEDISFSDDELRTLLGSFTDIELVVRVYDADDWFADDLAKERFHIYPLGEDKAAAFVREAQPTDTVLVDNDDFTILVTGYDPESFWGYAVKLYLVNKTDVPLTFSADDVSVNGFMCDPYWGNTVDAGKVAFSNMDWSTSTFEENSITDVEEIEFSLRVYNAEDLLADDLFSETFKLNP